LGVRVSFGAQPFDQGRYLPESGAIFGLGFVYLVGWPRLRREGALFPQVRNITIAAESLAGFAFVAG
jgi:hypothetical protein